MRCVTCGVDRPDHQVRKSPAHDGHHGVCTTCQPPTDSLRELLPPGPRRKNR